MESRRFDQINNLRLGYTMKKLIILVSIAALLFFNIGLQKVGNMAIAILDTDLLTASGNIVIPATCTMIHALVFGSELPPSIGGAVMSKIVSVPANTKVPAVSVHQFIVTDDDVTVPFVITGTHVTLYYTSGAGMYRSDVLLGNALSGILSGDLPAATTDLSIAILAGMIGATTIKGDTAAFTYDRNDTYLKTGHMVPGDTVLSCELKDVGVSAGYTIDGGSIHHDAVLIKAAWDTWDPVAHYVSWNYLYSSAGSNYYGEYDNGVATGNRWVQIPGSSVPAGRSYTAYVLTHHDAVYTPAWDEDLPDTVVPGGEQAQVNGIVVLIQTGAALEFVPKIVIGQ